MDFLVVEARLLSHRTIMTQEDINTFFRAQSSFWGNVYSGQGVFAEIIQDRHTAVLGWVDSLNLPRGSHVLEIGCGAGFMAVALALRGYKVCAIDSVEAMIEVTRDHAAICCVTEQLSADVGNVYALDFEDSSFDLVVAIGILPWLENIDLAISSMARVVKFGGHLILTSANPCGLPYLLDPLYWPALRPLRERVKAMLGRNGPGMAFHGRRAIIKVLSHAGVSVVKDMTLGFDFSLLRHKIIPEPHATNLYHRMQRSHNFHSLGMSYHVLARKCTPI